MRGDKRRWCAAGSVALNRTRRDLILDVRLKFAEKVITATLVAESKDMIQAEILSLEQEVTNIELNLDRKFEINVRAKSKPHSKSTGAAWK